MDISSYVIISGLITSLVVLICTETNIVIKY